MYFPIGWPKYFSSKDVHCGELIALRYNRDRSLLAVISAHSVCIWNNRPRVLVVAYRRSYESMREVGSNIGVVWRPDSSTLLVSTTEGKLVFLEVQKNSGAKLYTPCFASSGSNQGNNPSGANGVTAIKLVETAIVPITGGITSIAPRKDEVFVSTGSGLLQRILWDGNLEGRTTLSIHSLPFTNDLENARALPLEHEGVSFRAMEYSPLLGGFAIVLADGRGGFLSASTARFDPQEILGLWAKDLSSATCVAINHRYRLMAFGCLNGECLVYGFDDLTGALQLSHKLILSSKDYPDTIQSTGSVQCLSWTPDGCAIAVAWSWASHGGLAVWSVFGSLLMCTLGGDYGTSQEAFLHNPLHVKSMGWGPEGYNLALISAEEDNGTTDSVNYEAPGEIMQLQFVKSSLSVNPCMSNHEHLFLQSEECLYLNTGDMVSETTDVFRPTSGNPNLPEETWPSPGADRSMGHSTLVSNKQWLVVQISHTYLESNWPVRYTAVDKSGHHVAIAGRMGVAHYSLASRKWKLFGNISQEQSISCRGGLAWWERFLIVPCYNFQSSTDEVRFYPRTCNLDNAFAQHVKLPAPSFLVNVFRNLLLAYCSDCRVVFFSLEIPPGGPDSTIKVSRLREVSLAEHVPHPLAVIHVTLTSRYMESGDLEGLDGVEALITNVGGWLLMLQKEKASHGRSKKSSFSSPVVLASCVENVWASSRSNLKKRHLTEALWLSCGAHGMKVWLPLFPGNDQKPPNFLSKRIMLPFQLNIYPLAVLVQDAVVVGAENEPLPLECTSPGPASMSPQPFPFCTLERTTQVYLHHVLRQLLRRNLGQQALKIANTCVDLPYFPHVLELMLHEVLEEEATASEPIPDALLPRVVAFIQEFPQYLETVVHCARKTEVALWGYLFAAVGNPRELFKESLDLGRLETAASYLIILQNLEQPSVSKQLATILLDRTMDNCKWEIAKDLVRFLRCIGAGELESPPRSPTYKPMHSPPHTPAASVDGGDLSPSMHYGLTTHGRTASVTKPGSRGALSRPDKPHLSRTPSVEKKSGSLEKARKTFAASSSASPVEVRRPSDLETPDSFFIDTILNRHARLLLSASRLRDLGRFAAHLEFTLAPWLHKERNRAARIDDYVASVVSVHQQFDLPYPAVSTPAGSAHLPLSPKPWAMARFGRVGSSSSTGSPSTSRQSLCELDTDVTVEDAQLSPGRAGDDLSQVSGEPSETSSMTYSMDGDEASWPGESGEGLGSVDVDKIRAQLAVSGSKQACREIRFLLQNVMAAGCYEWWLVMALVLRDHESIRDCINKTQALRDVSTETVSRMKQGLAALEAWAEENCRGYSIFFSLHKPEWHVPSTPPAGRKTAPTERRDSGQTQEFSRGSRQASTSSDVTAPEEEERGGDEEPEGEEMKHDYDCVVM